MIILKSLTENAVRVIPRRGAPHNVIVQDEQSKEETIHFPVFSFPTNDTEFTFTQDLIEGRKYKLTITDASDNILYRDLMQAITTQEIEDYSLDNGEYETPQDDVVKTKYKFI
tara:strand:- start:3069 stop:3407 length:339 start_codon:yes stop_codon:yes gene_type:complete